MCLEVRAVGSRSVTDSYRTDSKEIPSFLLEERKVLVDSLHLVTWRFKIKQPSYYEHFPFLPFVSFRFAAEGGGIQGLCF